MTYSLLRLHTRLLPPVSHLLQRSGCTIKLVTAYAYY